MARRLEKRRGRSGLGIDMIRARTTKVDEKCQTNIDLCRRSRLIERGQSASQPVSQSATDQQWYRKTDQPSQLPAHVMSKGQGPLWNGNRILRLRSDEEKNEKDSERPCICVGRQAYGNAPISISDTIEIA